VATLNVILPELGEGVTEGELVRWLVKPGDAVKSDQPVAEMMTDKATVEVPTPQAGVVKEIKFKEGDVVKVEQVLLVLESASGGGAAVVADPAAVVAAPSPAAVHKSTPVVVAPMSASVSTDIYPPVAESRVLATPATRRLAREINVDLNQITGSGLAGRVTREDVVSAKSMNVGARPTYQSPTGAADERVPLRGVRKKIAENLQMSKQIIPHFTLMDEANVTELVKMRDALKELATKENTKITYLPFVMKALIATIRQFPMFNASIDDAAAEIVYKKYFNLGFAADTPNGLVVPVIKDADRKSILQLSKEIIDLSKRARDGKLKLEEMKGATITITNIGSVGGTYATPIINHPEVAILGMYKISDKVIVDESGGFKVIKAMNYTVTADHRLIDGAVAANFLKAFFERIQNPAVLMAEL
jgi:pyruvate dehydrogenase E2 component (dihydrolipoamide acetyltransferase)